MPWVCSKVRAFTEGYAISDDMHGKLRVKQMLLQRRAIAALIRLTDVDEA